MHEQNIDLLGKEAQRLLQLEIELLEKMLKEPGVVAEPSIDSDSIQQTFDRETVPKHIEVLRGEQAKLEALEMVLAVVGTMKAGKSTTINAIVGTEVLPNRNRPMTALPTLIRHTPMQTEPVLRFENNKPINDLIAKLNKEVKKPEAQAVLEELDKNPDMDELLGLIAKRTKFKATYQGADQIFWFLKSLNDLVRLSSELGVEFPFEDYDEVHEMPVIEVEFAHLREIDTAAGRLTLLDTPGPNEAGQQHLRKMLKEQLRKASAVLAVLDFTQLKSDADNEIRQELEEIASVAEGRLYTLVNKFDEKDRHGDSEEQVKAFVAESLMGGVIQKSDVFPVSSRWGYLANRAKHELYLNKKLPSYTEQPWVEDFAEEALGRRWEKKLDDLEEVQHAADELWKDSLFSEPLENVIHSAHRRAAVFAIDSGAAKLIDVAEKIGNFLGVRQTALSKSVQELQSQIDSLRSDIEKIETCERETRSKVESTLGEVTKETGRIFDQVKSDAVKSIDGYFAEGKKTEKKLAVASAKKNKEIGGVKYFWMNLMSSSSTARVKSRADSKIDFDPKSPIIKFDSKAEANNLVKKMQGSVGNIIKNADGLMREGLSAVLSDFSEDFSSTVSVEARTIAEELSSRLAGEGFSVTINIPETKNIGFDYSASDILEDVINKRTKTVTRRRRQSGVWGTICGWFDTDDWGWEEYQTDKKYYEIDIRKVRSSSMSAVEQAFSGLDKAVSKTIQKPLEEEVSEFFHSFKATVERVRGDLIQGMRDQESSKAEQEAFSIRLASLQKNVPAILKDSRELKEDIDPLLAAGAEA